MLKAKTYLVLLLLFSSSALANEREDTVCGAIQERLVFAFWSAATPLPNASRVNFNGLVNKIKFTTADNRVLKGYRYKAQDRFGKETKAKGYLLMALGNAMIADQVISSLSLYSERGYDIYIYDYRGYGESEGKRRINAFIEDYKELVKHLNNRYDRAVLYGVSLGGAVMANVVGSGIKFDRAVIDSSPSRFSPYGCPKRIDPVENIPNNAQNILVITGELDRILSANMTYELREVAEKKGAATYNGLKYGHPFMDRSISIHLERMKRIGDFLDGY